MRWLLVVVLIGLLFVLSPMAFASPPDPSWLGGFWDDADFDEPPAITFDQFRKWAEEADRNRQQVERRLDRLRRIFRR